MVDKRMLWILCLCTLLMSICCTACSKGTESVGDRAITREVPYDKAEETKEHQEPDVIQEGKFPYEIEDRPIDDDMNKKYYVWEEGPASNFIDGAALVRVYSGAYGYDRVRAVVTWYGKAYVVGSSVDTLGEGYYTFDTKGNGFCVFDSKGKVVYKEDADATIEYKSLYGYYKSEKTSKQYFFVKQGRQTIDGKINENYVKICNANGEKEKIVDFSSFDGSESAVNGIENLGKGMFVINRSKGTSILFDCESEEMYGLPNGVTFENRNYIYKGIYGDCYSDSGYIVGKVNESIVLINRRGEVLLNIPGEVYGPLGNEMFFTDGFFYNINGDRLIDLSKYTFDSVPVFKDGYACLNIVNQDKFVFNTIIDTNGDFLYEPQGGKICGEINDNHILVYSENTAYYQDLHGNTEWSALCDNAYALGEGIICLQEERGYDNEDMYRFYTLNQELLFEKVYTVESN